MPIGNLSNKVSSSDVDKVKTLRNPPEYEPGFEPSGGSSNSDGDDFDSLFGDDSFSFDDLGDFGSTSSNNSLSGGLGNNASGFGSGFGGGFGSSGFGGGFGSSFGSPFGQQVNQQNQQNNKPDLMDKALDASCEAFASIGQILMDMVRSTKSRNADDFAYYSRNLIITGVVMAGVGLLSVLLGIGGGFKVLKGLGVVSLSSGLLTVGSGLMGIGFSAIMVAQMGNYSQMSVEQSLEQLPDVATFVQDDNTKDYEDNLDDILGDLFGDGEDSGDLFNDSEDSTFKDNSSSSNIFNPSFDNISYTTEEVNNDKVDFSSKLEKIKENQYLSREILFNTFRDFFPVNTPNFAEKKQLSPDSEEFQTIETICLKALSNVAKCELEEVNSHLESAYESYFSYELRLKRVRGLNKLDDIAREMEAYFRDSSTDTSVNATVDVEGDFYKITVTKGVTAVVTFGDMFKLDYVRDFYLNPKNKLPFAVGISELGEVILEDAKVHDTMLIAGKPRSGKSWYVLSILMSLMMFNTPEEVQFIIVDPKESNLFKTVALMPHVAGLHNDSNILDVMRDLIENEAPRRKKLLADNRCDDIWALWEKGIKIPVLYLVIDEVITVKNNLGALDKEFDNLMQTIITQFPSLGIRMLFVPHRATGIINKTNRTMISFAAAVRSNIDDVKDTLGIQKWTRSLTNPGDIAVKLSNKDNAMYVRGVAITTSDAQNTELIENAARAFYKMGVDLPDMSRLTVAYNRDEDAIREALSTNSKRVQYNASNLFDDIK